MANTDYILSAQIKLLGTNGEVVSCVSNCPRRGISSRDVYDPFIERRLDEAMPSDELKDYGDEQRRVQTVNGFQKFETKLRITSVLAQRIDVYVFIETSSFHLVVDNVSMRLASPIPAPVNVPVSQQPSPVAAPLSFPDPIMTMEPISTSAPVLSLTNAPGSLPPSTSPDSDMTKLPISTSTPFISLTNSPGSLPPVKSPDSDLTTQPISTLAPVLSFTNSPGSLPPVKSPDSDLTTLPSSTPAPVLSLTNSPGSPQPVTSPVPFPIVLPMPVMAPLVPPISTPVIFPVTLPVPAPVAQPIPTLTPVAQPVSLFTECNRDNPDACMTFNEREEWKPNSLSTLTSVTINSVRALKITKMLSSSDGPTLKEGGQSNRIEKETSANLLKPNWIITFQANLFKTGTTTNELCDIATNCPALLIGFKDGRGKLVMTNLIRDYVSSMWNPSGPNTFRTSVDMSQLVKESDWTLFVGFAAFPSSWDVVFYNFQIKRDIY